MPSDYAIAFWIILAVVLCVVEASTLNLVSIWFALGCLGGVFAAAIGLDFVPQFAFSVVLSIILLILTKPFVKKIRLRAVKTNANRIIGETGEVLERIDPISGTGQVKVLGQVWSAKSEDRCAIEAGTKVEITGIEGVKAIVKEIK